MSVKDMADYLGVTVATVIGNATGGRIPGVKVGKSWVFSKVVVDEWLREEAKRRIVENGWKKVKVILRKRPESLTGSFHS